MYRFTSYQFSIHPYRFVTKLLLPNGSHYFLRSLNSMTIMMIKCHCWYAFIARFHYSFATPFLRTLRRRRRSVSVSALSNAIFNKLFLNHSFRPLPHPGSQRVKAACSHDVPATHTFCLPVEVEKSETFGRGGETLRGAKHKWEDKYKISTIDVWIFIRFFIFSASLLFCYSYFLVQSTLKLELSMSINLLRGRNWIV